MPVITKHPRWLLASGTLLLLAGLSACDFETEPGVEVASDIGSTTQELGFHWSPDVLWSESDFFWVTSVTGWRDGDDPSGTGDYEMSDRNAELAEACETPYAIQCRRKADGASWKHTGDSLSCTPGTGLVCRNADQLDGECEDYEVRYSCARGMWTDFLDRDDQSGTGDYEMLKDFRKRDQACEAPIAIYCETTSGVPHHEAGERVTCNATEGFICRNSDQPDGQCEDYRVSFYCPLDDSWEREPPSTERSCRAWAVLEARTRTAATYWSYVGVSDATIGAHLRATQAVYKAVCDGRMNNSTGAPILDRQKATGNALMSEFDLVSGVANSSSDDDVPHQVFEEATYLFLKQLAYETRTVDYASIQKFLDGELDTISIFGSPCSSGTPGEVVALVAPGTPTAFQSPTAASCSGVGMGAGGVINPPGNGDSSGGLSRFLPGGGRESPSCYARAKDAFNCDPIAQPGPSRELSAAEKQQLEKLRSEEFQTRLQLGALALTGVAGVGQFVLHSAGAAGSAGTGLAPVAVLEVVEAVRNAAAVGAAVMGMAALYEKLAQNQREQDAILNGTGGVDKLCPIIPSTNVTPPVFAPSAYGGTASKLDAFGACNGTCLIPGNCDGLKTAVACAGNPVSREGLVWEECSDLARKIPSYFPLDLYDFNKCALMQCADPFAVPAVSSDGSCGCVGGDTTNGPILLPGQFWTDPVPFP